LNYREEILLLMIFIGFDIPVYPPDSSVTRVFNNLEIDRRCFDHMIQSHHYIAPDPNLGSDTIFWPQKHILSSCWVPKGYSFLGHFAETA